MAAGLELLKSIQSPLRQIAISDCDAFSCRSDFVFRGDLSSQNDWFRPAGVYTTEEDENSQ